jgi:hypothetical protein
MRIFSLRLVNHAVEVLRHPVAAENARRSYPAKVIRDWLANS